MLRQLTLVLLTLALQSAIAQPIQAGVIFGEAGDAGELLPGAMIVPGGVSEIHGSIDPLGDIDLYQLTFAPGETVSVNILVPGTFFDTDVTIFNSSGQPVSVHDPNNFSFTATTGTVYFALADWNVYATDSSGTIIADDYAGVLETSAVLGGWVANTSPLRGGDYEIVFSVDTTAAGVPEPTCLMLLGLSMTALCVHSVRSRRHQTRSAHAV